jgi:hypothetical protein
MSGTAPVLQFYLPHRGPRREPLPESVADYWPWMVRNRQLGDGRYAWTLLSYLYLKETDVPCRLAGEFPREGLVISHRDFLPLVLPPRPDVFLVCIKPDRKEHTWAHFYVVQNASDSIFRGANADRARYIHHWPQPSLIARERERGERCEHAAYFGRPLNLADELRSEAFAARLSALGLAWSPAVPFAEWHDYRRVDVTISIRSLGREVETSNPILDPNSKPPSKLVNSWHAGVPAIVGRESAFANVRLSELDYLEAGSLDELLASLSRLQREPRLYSAMVVHGRNRAREFAPEAILTCWIELLHRDVLPRFRDWMARSAARRQSSNLIRVARFFASPTRLAAIKWNRQAAG